MIVFAVRNYVVNVVMVNRKLASLAFARFVGVGNNASEIRE